MKTKSVKWGIMAMAVLSVVEVACANISVVKQNAMDMARAIRSL
jgi:hypothetical protein